MFCDVGGVKMYCEVTGEGVPVLALHGFGVDHRLMKSGLEPIFVGRARNRSSSSGYRRVYVDLPGMGLTRATDWPASSDQMLDFVVQFVGKVMPGERFLAAGSSYGGYLARGLAYRMPDRVDGLLLVVPMVVADRTKRDRPPKRFVFRDEPLLSRLRPEERADLEFSGTVLDEKCWSRVRTDILPATKIADEPFLARLERGGYAFSFDVGGRFGTFDRPALLLAGRQDTVVGYRDAMRLLDDLPRGTFAVLDRAAHNLEFEQQCIFECLVNEWLDRVEEYHDNPVN